MIFSVVSSDPVEGSRAILTKNTLQELNFNTKKNTLSHVLLTMKRNRSGKNKSASSLSERAGLVFPVEDVRQTCTDALSGQVVEEDAAVFLIGVLEYLVLEILTLASQTALLRGSPNITLHDLPGLQDKKTYAVLLERCKEREVQTE